MAAVNSQMQKVLPVAAEKEILSEEKIQALLLEAEQRLLKKSVELSKIDGEDNDVLTLVEEPKVETRVR